MIDKKIEAEPKERRVKVLCKRSVWLTHSNSAVAKKVPAGMVVLMTVAEIKHFGSAVTKDIPDEENEYERA